MCYIDGQASHSRRYSALSRHIPYIQQKVNLDRPSCQARFCLMSSHFLIPSLLPLLYLPLVLLPPAPLPLFLPILPP